MKNYFFSFILISFLFTSCIERTDIEPNSAAGNFKALWEIIDTRYCYLDYKNINWDDIYSQYYALLPGIETEMELFDLLGRMLAELKDGHVNLYAPFDVSRYWDWSTEYPGNFNSSIIFSDKYLGKDYKIGGGMYYDKIDNGNIGYIYYGSFSNGFSDQTMSYIFDYFKDCRGLIIDVRDNEGGSLAYSELLASYFTKNEVITGYMAHKTGPGHSDFSTLKSVKTAPNINHLYWDKPVAVLTNRSSYSATNDFVNRVQNFSRVITVGDKTGGGGGMPLSSELPIGWMVRFSACPMYDIHKNHIEWGIEPQYPVALDEHDLQNDAIIDQATRLLKNSY